MKIYGFFNSRREFGDAQAIAIDETGKIVATHVSSNESFAAHDLGMTESSTRKHDIYHTNYPGGWQCEFVRIRDRRDTHPGLQAALTLLAKGD